MSFLLLCARAARLRGEQMPCHENFVAADYPCALTPMAPVAFGWTYRIVQPARKILRILQIDRCVKAENQFRSMH
jgi:hypothetical protein